ncbi:membrane protein insertase YidC [Nocardia alni]|uniref:membrane protein insertase YidC n=1 Tax=Nocardia alni TaxID=2815723 RepID=UPI001C219B9D|nr:membrane protein insertase YidC [Nocardia alni]
MLDFIYYPVSWILWFWHRVFGFALGDNNGFAWALAVVFLVFTLRMVLYWPFVKQVRTTRQMQQLQPKIKELQRKYKNDRQKMATEMQKLQREHGFNPLMGCLPVLAQVPVFIGLYHVLRSFNRVGVTSGIAGFGHGGGMSVYANAHTPNYAFGVGDVQSFLSARIFGAPISAAITTPKSQLAAFADFGGIPHVANMVAVAVPLMLIAGLATHLNARASVARQRATGMSVDPTGMGGGGSPSPMGPNQAEMMNKLALYVFPLGVIVGGPFLPVAILIYWVSNNIWTFGQQHVVFKQIDKEEAHKKQEALDRRAANAPKPGAKPEARRKRSGATDAVEEATVDDVVDAPVDAPVVGNADSTQSKNGTAKPGKAAASSGKSTGQGNRKRSGNRGRPNQKRRR